MLKWACHLQEQEDKWKIRGLEDKARQVKKFRGQEDKWKNQRIRGQGQTG
jgi:hypothetical protein